MACSIQAKPSHSPLISNTDNSNCLAVIVKIALQFLQDICGSVKRFFVAEVLEIGVHSDGYKPKIIITGERVAHEAIQALRKHTSNFVEFVKLEDLEKNQFDSNKDILIIANLKLPGNNPIRLFAALDGPLYKHKASIMRFDRKAVLIIKHSSEHLTDVQLNDQLKKQLKEMPGAIMGSNLRHLAETVKKIFP